MTDLTRKLNSMQKKSLSVMAVLIVEGEEVDENAGNHLLANLPADSVITNAYIVVQTASDAATAATATLGTASAGAQLLTGANLKTLGKQGTFVPGVSTGTGAEVWLNVTKTGAKTAVAKYLVVVEYLEYTKNTGEYTAV